MKKLFVLLLVLLMAVPCALADTVNATGLPLSEEEIVLKVAVIREASDQASSMDDKPFVKHMTENTNIRFEWIDIISDSSTVINTLLANPADMPDMFWGGITSSIVEANPGLFLAIEDLMPVYGTNMLKFYEEYGFDFEGECMHSDGHIYSVPTRYIRSESNMVYNIPVINQAWLDQLGLEAPTTTEEFYNVLVAFRDNDMDGDGDPSNEIPFGMNNNKWECGPANILAWFGLTDVYYNIRDGKVESTLTTQAFRDGLDYIHRLYAEGLIDPECFTKDSNQLISNEQENLVGVYYVWVPHTDLTMECEFLANIVPLYGKIEVDSYEGYEDSFTVRVNNLEPWAIDTLVISANTEHPEACIRVLDYMYEDLDQLYSMMRGPEGYTWVYDDDGYPVNTNWTTEEKAAILEKLGLSDTFSADMQSSSLYLESAHLLTPMSPGTMAPSEDDPIPQGGYLRSQWIRSVEAYQPKEQMSKLAVSTELQEEFDFRCEGLTTFVNQFITNSVLDGVTDESWSDFQATLKTYDYEFYLSYYQQKLDGGH